MNPVDFGTAFIRPDGEFEVASTGTWKILYTVGKYGIDDGGSILIARRAMSDALMPQCNDPSAPGYVTAITDGDAAIKVFYDNRYWIRPIRGSIVVKVFDGSLKSGDTITVTIGDRSSGSPGWRLQTFPETNHSFKVLVDAFGTREYYHIANQPSITLIPGQPESIEAVIPTTARPDQNVLIRIRVLDSWGNPLDAFDGDISITVPDNSVCDKKVISLRENMANPCSIRFTVTGIFTVECSAGAISGRSNPIIVSHEEINIYWGDMHGQTEETVGTGSIEEYLRFARDKAFIDVTGWQGNDFQVTDETWDEVCAQTKKFNVPGKFVTFLGYEWSGLTPAGGDHNIMYLNDDQPIHRSSHWQIHDGSSDVTDRYPISELWNEFRGRDDVMAIAHVGGRYANFDYWDENLSGLVEIHSHHGTFEWFAEDAIRRGHIVGLVGQSDDHTGRPGLSAPLEPLARDFATFDVCGGYTGIFADNLTRESVWDALKKRHCYATTGTRIFLNVEANEKHMMGDVVFGVDTVDLSVEIAGTAPLLDVEIKRDTETVYRYPFEFEPDDEWIRIEWSGVRIKSRSKTADWDGKITINGGVIEDFTAYAFDQKSQGVRRINETELEVLSTTSGDIDGVFLKVRGKSPTISYENRNSCFTVISSKLSQTPKIFNAGGVNLKMRFSKISPFNRPNTLSFSFKDETATKGAYWTKVVQIDGHMAWSSPVYYK